MPIAISGWLLGIYSWCSRRRLYLSGGAFLRRGWVNDQLVINIEKLLHINVVLITDFGFACYQRLHNYLTKKLNLLLVYLNPWTTLNIINRLNLCSQNNDYLQIQLIVVWHYFSSLFDTRYSIYFHIIMTIRFEKYHEWEVYFYPFAHLIIWSRFGGSNWLYYIEVWASR